MTEPGNFCSSSNFKHMRKYNKGEPSTGSHGEQEGGVYPPLPQGPPPPNSPPAPLITPKVELEEYATECVGAEAEPIMCRQYARGACTRGQACVYAHEIILSQLPGVYTFCRDYQNSTCSFPRCKFVHATVFEKEHFYRTGFMPPHALEHLKECARADLAPVLPAADLAPVLPAADLASVLPAAYRCQLSPAPYRCQPPHASYPYPLPQVSAAEQTTAAPMAAAQMTAGPMAAAQMTAGPMAAAQMTAGPMAAAQMTAAPMAAAQMTAAHLPPAPNRCHQPPPPYRYPLPPAPNPYPLPQVSAAEQMTAAPMAAAQMTAAPMAAAQMTAAPMAAAQKTAAPMAAAQKTAAPMAAAQMTAAHLPPTPNRCHQPPPPYPYPLPPSSYPYPQPQVSAAEQMTAAPMAAAQMSAAYMAGMQMAAASMVAPQMTAAMMVAAQMTAAPAECEPAMPWDKCYNCDTTAFRRRQCLHNRADRLRSIVRPERNSEEQFYKSALRYALKVALSRGEYF